MSIDKPLSDDPIGGVSLEELGLAPYGEVEALADLKALNQGTVDVRRLLLKTTTGRPFSIPIERVVTVYDDPILIDVDPVLQLRSGPGEHVNITGISAKLAFALAGLSQAAGTKDGPKAVKEILAGLTAVMDSYTRLQDEDEIKVFETIFEQRHVQSGRVFGLGNPEIKDLTASGIAAGCGLSEERVDAALKRLEEKKIVENVDSRWRITF